MDKYKKVIIILAVVFGCIIIGYIAGQTNSNNQVNLTNAINETNETIEQTYITKYTWNEKDVKTFNNTYYVDRGYKDEPEVMQYVLLRCETQKGDLEAGTYRFETDETVGANFLIYIVDEPIDLNTYDGNQYEQIVHNNVDHTTKDLEIKQGQYIYIQKGFNPNGTMIMEKRQ